MSDFFICKKLKQNKGLGSIRAIFGLIFKIIRIMSYDTKEVSSVKNENNF